jgi:hypothetical protein
MPRHFLFERSTWLYTTTPLSIYKLSLKNKKKIISLEQGLNYKGTMRKIRPGWLNGKDKIFKCMFMNIKVEMST